MHEGRMPLLTRVHEARQQLAVRQPGDPYGDIYTGWAYPPKDYDRWRELIYQWVKHSVERYGPT